MPTPFTLCPTGEPVVVGLSFTSLTQPDWVSDTKTGTEVDVDGTTNLLKDPEGEVSKRGGGPQYGLWVVPTKTGTTGLEGNRSV